ncbi:hypothetical protein ONZ45_g10209 [Pleurotus djamor]|nr:hypothetical protein ONZ45_g10209 [Pleurotus djamor]
MYPENSFLFDAYSDPPTATLQRIKAITTGSLPTFVDIGSNFGGSSILEDSIIARLKAAGKRLAFMGDDTWMTVFPDSFNPNMTHPFDSFNVEDLHTVDRGVIANLCPLLAAPTPSFDFLIGHFLGVDHVGHRVGPEHISMKDKLQEMNSVLERVVEMLDDDTLLVVLGDHGMDRSGDHGGDGDLETSSALWIYSKSRKLSQASSGEDIPLVMTPKKTFPGSSVPHRRVQQIDLVPTLSLLLGLPIPFNNLGTVIPELFNRESLLSRALSINVAQIKDYLDAYRSSASGGELDASWSSLTRSWTGASTTQQQYEFTRLALETCRSLWAQFNAVRMGMGLILLGVGALTTWSIYSTDLSPSVTSNSLLKGGYGLVAGLALGLTSFPLIKSSSMFADISLSDHTLFLSTLFSCIPILVTSFASSSIAAPSLATALQVLFPILLLVLHSLAFLSNSFTFWEDRLAPFLLVSSILPFVVKGFTAPTARLRSRIFGFSLAFSLCIRLMAISTVCREEQQPYCHVTFYSSSSTPTSPLFIRLLALPVAYGLPLFIQRMLAISRSDAGIAKLFLLGILRISLLSSAAAWLLEWVDSARLLEGSGWNNDSPRTARTMATWVACFVITFVGTVLWYLVPMCLDIKQEEGTADEQQLAAATLASAPKTRQIKIIGFANAFGAPYVLFYSIPFALVFASTQLTGQVVLALSMVALLAYLEVVDSVRDVRALEAAFSSATPSAILNNPNLFGASSSSPSSSSFPSPSIRFAEIVPIALLGIQTFYSTGHQAVISSIQWKSAFILTKELKYPWNALQIASHFMRKYHAPFNALNEHERPSGLKASSIPSPPSSQTKSQDVAVAE